MGVVIDVMFSVVFTYRHYRRALWCIHVHKEKDKRNSGNEHRAGHSCNLSCDECKLEGQVLKTWPMGGLKLPAANDDIRHTLWAPQMAHGEAVPLSNLVVVGQLNGRETQVRRHQEKSKMNSLH